MRAFGPMRGVVALLGRFDLRPEFKDKAYQLRIRRILVAIGLLTLLPSLYVAYTVVQEAI